MKFSILYFAVICVFVRFTRAQNDTSVDCTSPPRFVPQFMCCPVPDLITNELMKQCAQHAAPPPPPPPPARRSSGESPMRGPPPRDGPPPPDGPPMHPCLMECIFNQTEVIGQDGELNAKNFEQLLSTVVKNNKEMSAAMKESFDTCAQTAKKLKAMIDEEESKHSETSIKNSHPFCSPFSAMIMGCIKMQTFQNCPTSAWNDSEDCNANRKFSKECLESL